jgi:hypothetical protein
MASENSKAFHEALAEYAPKVSPVLVYWGIHFRLWAIVAKPAPAVVPAAAVNPA